MGEAIEVPQKTVYAVSLEAAHEVTPPSPPAWQPGALMSGFRRPSSHGPQLENVVIESSFELSAPTVMWFFAVAGGATL